MPASNRVIWGAAAAVAALGVVALTWRPAPDALYCIGRPGTLWNGLMPLPDGLTPRCPSSATYRQEVQGGLSRVEQYVARGWQPQVLMAPLRRAGYVLLEDETRGAQHYSVFMGRQTPAELYYTAVPDGADTLITISGH
ncbi:hypothetical protein GCM10008956_37460 [Deinococcus arenae]|uniref:Uncharacterized protein n=1 Tax=Deinococcus arenae TaxID=1452751 RepID=A0A8H9GX68_9DEIO|nr:MULTISPECIES: hypothetical protein [Deinococcus]GGM58352.1 hypothetical protein GCM10008956_37460 [Deinococcus arenae]